METNSTLVRTDCVVELHAVADIGLNLALVVGPQHAERKNAVGLDHSLYYLGTFEFRMLLVHVFYAQQHFFDCLQILLFTGVFGFQI